MDNRGDIVVHQVCLSLSVVLGVLQASGQTEMKRVVGDNATLPCHHQLWHADTSLLDIEWLLVKPNAKQKAVRAHRTTHCQNRGKNGNHHFMEITTVSVCPFRDGPHHELRKI